VAEAALAGPLRGVLVAQLGLDDPARAARLVRRESRSGRLMLMALRALLAAVAADTPPHALGLEGDLEQVIARADGYSAAEAVRAHAVLLLSLLRLDRARRRVTALLDECHGADIVRRSMALYVDADVAAIETDARAALAALTSNAVADPEWDPRPDADRHRWVVRALFHHVRLAEEALTDLEQRFVDGLCHHHERDLGVLRTEDAWDAVVAPLREGGQPLRVTVLLVGGLSWQAWDETLSPRLAEVYDSHARVALAPLPAVSDRAMRRALGGARSDAAAPLPWPKLPAAARPELGLKSLRQPPNALAALADEGLLLTSAASGGLHVAVVDLLAGSPAGLALDDYERRVALLGEALAGLARSRRPDDAVVLVGASGAVRCADAPGLALPGEAPAARSLRGWTGERTPTEAVRLELGSAPGVAPEPWLLATGRGRLAPAPQGVAVADGGLSLAELATPVVVMTPLPPGERSLVLVSGLGMPDTVTGGEPAEAELYCTLAGGALAELATLTLDVPGAPEVSVTLDYGERRRLGLLFIPDPPTGAKRAELVVEATCRIGRRCFRRRAVCTVEAPSDGHRSTDERADLAWSVGQAREVRDLDP
jgi:hypothetical protein